MSDFNLHRNVATSDLKLAGEILSRIQEGDSPLSRRCELNRVKHWISRVTSNIDVILDMSKEEE